VKIGENLRFYKKWLKMKIWSKLENFKILEKKLTKNFQKLRIDPYEKKIYKI